MGEDRALRLYAEVPQTRTLGPDLRYAIWVQGCSFRCRGCMTPGSLSLEGGTVVGIEELASRILSVEGIEGLTISGGEPFLQAESLALLVKRLREVRDLGVIVYSGYRLFQLKGLAERKRVVAELLRETDLLIDGPYTEAQNQGGRLRGSENQEIHALTSRYEGVLGIYQEKKRAIEIHFPEETQGVAMLVGVPSKEQLNAWRAWSQTRLQEARNR